MAIIPAKPVTETVYMLADRPNLKAGGTDAITAQPKWPQWWPGGQSPFTDAASRKAYRHGGAVPWSMLKEVITGVPAPADDCYYVTEIAGDYDDYLVENQLTYPALFAHEDWYWTTDASPPGSDPPPYKFTPKPALGDFMAAADANRPKRLIRPQHPRLSTDDERGFTWAGAMPGPGDPLTHGPAALAVAGLMRRMQLIKVGVGSPNDKTLSAQAQYFTRVPGGSINSPYAGLPGDKWFLIAWNGTKWTVTESVPATPYCWTFAQMRHGWLYNPIIDPQTGCITEAFPMPEGAGMMSWRANAAFIVMGDPTMRVPSAFALTAPTGWRAIVGGAYEPTPGGGAVGPAPQLVWRPAPAWHGYIRLEGKGYVGWWDPTNVTIPPFWDTYGPIWNGYEYERPLLFRGYDQSQETAARTAAAPWNVLCTFPSWNGAQLGAGVLGSTLPTPGQEIIVTGWHPSMALDYPEKMADMVGTFYFEPSVSQVAIPLMHGGVIQGSLP